MWICIHYISSHLYTYYCTPSDIIGFILSPLLSDNHFCHGLRWCIVNGSYMISSMWLIIGSCIGAILIK